jgi:ribosomal protein L21
MNNNIKIIDFNNKQYCCYNEEKVTVDFIDKEVGSSVDVELFAEEKDGKMTFPKKTISAKILEHSAHKKVETLKFRTRQRSSKKTFGAKRRITVLGFAEGGKK